MVRPAAALGLLVIAFFPGCVTSRPDPTVSAPAALPAAAVAPSQRTIQYPHGQWVLYGDGSSAVPYAWVWVPTGATPPPAR
jgi:hypothetical protein